MGSAPETPVPVPAVDRRWLWAVGIAALIFLLLVGGNLVGDRVMWKHIAGQNQIRAVGSLEAIEQAQNTYAKAHPDRGFAATLAELGPPPGADLIGPLLASGKRPGYRFTLVPGPPDSSGRIVSYAVSARPMKYDRTGRRSFFMDESGVIRWTREDRAATAADPVL